VNFKYAFAAVPVLVQTTCFLFVNWKLFQTGGALLLGAYNLLQTIIFFALLFDGGGGKSLWKFSTGIQSAGQFFLLSRTCRSIIITSTFAVVSISVLLFIGVATFANNSKIEFYSDSVIETASSVTLSFLISGVLSILITLADIINLHKERILLISIQYLIFVIFVYFFQNPNIYQIFYISAFSSMVTLLCLSILVLRRLTFPFALICRWHLSHSAPHIKHSAQLSISNVLVSLFDPLIRFLITFTGGVAALGIFELIIRPITAIKRIQAAVTSFMISRTIRRNQNDAEQSKLFRYYFRRTAILFFAAGMIIFSPYFYIYNMIKFDIIAIYSVLLLSIFINLFWAEYYYKNQISGNVLPNILAHLSASFAAPIIFIIFGSTEAVAKGASAYAAGTIVATVLSARLSRFR
jgi:hypothetical protein